VAARRFNVLLMAQVYTLVVLTSAPPIVTRVDVAPRAMPLNDTISRLLLMVRLLASRSGVTSVV